MARSTKDEAKTVRKHGLCAHISTLASVLRIPPSGLARALKTAGLTDEGAPSTAAIELGLGQSWYTISLMWRISAVRDWLEANHSALFERAQRKRDSLILHAEAIHAEDVRIKGLARNVQTEIQESGCSLVDAVELLVDEPQDRATVFAHRKGWFLHNYSDKFTRSAVSVRLESDHARLLRRVA